MLPHWSARWIKLELSTGACLNLIDGLFYPKWVFYTTTENPTKYCVLEILRNILYHTEYSCDYTINRGSADYPTFSIAYLSVLHITILRKYASNSSKTNKVRRGQRTKHVLDVLPLKNMCHPATRTSTVLACIRVCGVYNSSCPCGRDDDRLAYWWADKTAQTMSMRLRLSKHRQNITKSTL